MYSWKQNKHTNIKSAYYIFIYARVFAILVQILLRRTLIFSIHTYRSQANAFCSLGENGASDHSSSKSCRNILSHKAIRSLIKNLTRKKNLFCFSFQIDLFKVKKSPSLTCIVHENTHCICFLSGLKPNWYFWGVIWHPVKSGIIAAVTVCENSLFFWQHKSKVVDIYLA